MALIHRLKFIMGIYHYCRTSPPMRYHGGAARSCSSFADLTPKNIQRFKANVATGRAARRFLGEIATPGRPGESLLQFLVGINQCPRIIDGLSNVFFWSDRQNSSSYGPRRNDAA